ncbi:uncharacterized protein LOC130748468 [Lotus japonicus]|uniref:uncharacterized protein LOC130748468 n=1 Tax=Lotus japonicus TaxID=34305 RepID=UPI002582631B|nr:uncharacterized protein LOC130748468 [Lotus japonicus]
MFVYITLVAVKISRQQSYLLDDTIWCIPPSFVEDVYKGLSIEKLVRAYFNPFMAPYHTLRYIYVLMKNDSGHWYLMVISIVEYVIYYFDSHLNVEDIPIRCASMRTMCDTLV